MDVMQQGAAPQTTQTPTAPPRQDPLSDPLAADPLAADAATGARPRAGAPARVFEQQLGAAMGQAPVATGGMLFDRLEENPILANNALAGPIVEVLDALLDATWRKNAEATLKTMMPDVEAFVRSVGVKDAANIARRMRPHLRTIERAHIWLAQVSSGAATIGALFSLASLFDRHLELRAHAQKMGPHIATAQANIQQAAGLISASDADAVIGAAMWDVVRDEPYSELQHRYSGETGSAASAKVFVSALYRAKGALDSFLVSYFETAQTCLKVAHDAIGMSADVTTLAAMLMGPAGMAVLAPAGAVSIVNWTLSTFGLSQAALKGVELTARTAGPMHPKLNFASRASQRLL